VSEQGDRFDKNVDDWGNDDDFRDIYGSSPSDDYWDLFDHHYDLRLSDPEAAVKGMMQARDMAEAAGDGRSMVFMSHWILQTLLWDLRELTRTYDLAVKSALEARKPQYQDMMEHICTQEDLISTYLGLDPVGYADMIEEAIEYMRTEITGPLQCRYCLQDLRCSFQTETNRLDQAEVSANEYLASTEDAREHRDHHRAAAYARLCDIAYRQGRWEDLLNYAQLGESHARRSRSLIYTVCYMLACQALAHRKLGNEKEAESYYRQATSRASRTKLVMPREYFDVLCLYHEAEGDLQAAWGIRERELEALRGKGQNFWEAHCRIERCRLLHHMGKSVEEEAAQARQLIQAFKAPETLLRALEAALA